MTIDPHQRFIRNTAIGVLACGSLAAGVAAWLHAMEPHPAVLDLSISTALAGVLACLAGLLALRPEKIDAVIWAGFAAALLALALPAWVYGLRADADPGMRLVDTLPPIAPAMLPLVLAMIVFLPPRQAFAAALVSWLLVASPVLGYLVAHPAQLRSPRGMDLVMTLGPAMLLMLAFIPFHRGIERRFEAVRSERARLQVLAERDGLTGLYNRRASEHLLGNLVAAPDPADGLILFDIDHFKRINDTHGHPAGDEVLRQVARRCEAKLRRDDVLARWGGEEFLLLARGAHGEASALVAEALRQAIAATPIDPAGTVTASFGVATYRPGDSLANWIERVDAALYEAKAGGRNRVVAR